MRSWVRPELPTASVGSSQAPTAAVDNSAPSAIRPVSTYKSGNVVQTNGATSVVWPDEFWVTDEYALEIAERSFPGRTVLQVPNRYVETQLREIARVADTDTPELLYVLEPIRTDWGRGTPGEFQALDYFASRLRSLDLPSATVIRLRPHPSDEPGKYDQWITRHSHLNIRLDDSLGITQAMGRASWVAGCESFALVLALMAGRKVYCTLPPWAPACRLPHRGLIQVRSSGREP